MLRSKHRCRFYILLYHHIIFVWYSMWTSLAYITRLKFWRHRNALPRAVGEKKSFKPCKYIDRTGAESAGDSTTTADYYSVLAINQCGFQPHVAIDLYCILLEIKHLWVEFIFGGRDIIYWISPDLYSPAKFRCLHVVLPYYMQYSVTLPFYNGIG